MIKNTQRLHNFAKLPLALAVAAAMSTPVSAFQFFVGEIEANLDTTLTAGASWRVADRDKHQLGVGNLGPLGDNPYTAPGSEDHYSGGSSLNNDDGSWNFDKGDTYSRIVKGSTEFALQSGEYGMLVSARYWYDFQLKDRDMATDDAGKQRQLSPDGDDNASGAEFLDAYVWKNTTFNDMPLSVRLGKQVVSWGESTFIFNGINVINPVDIGALRAPGATLKEALLPVNMAYGSLGVSENLTVEAFVQLEFEPTRIDDCGTFFSDADYVADGCGPVLALGTLPEDSVAAQNLVVPRMADIEADDTDQFGVAFRLYVPEFNETELGFYFIQYHNRFPTVSGVVAQDPTSTATALNPVTGAKYLVEYAEQIKLFGISFNTLGPLGISLGGEYSFKQDMPVQANTFDLLFGAIANPLSPLFQDRVPDVTNVPGGGAPDGLKTGSDAIASGFTGSFQHGYDRYDVSQMQFTAIKFVDQILGASRLSFVGEVGATYVHGLPELNEMRYGRNAQLGLGLSEIYGLAACQAANFNWNGCTNKGYVTDFSWGYRMLASLLYSDVFSGVNLTPALAWSQDVEGNAPGPGANFIEGRKSIGVSLNADFLNKYSATFSYINYFDGGLYNNLTDKDNVSLSVAYSF